MKKILTFIMAMLLFSSPAIAALTVNNLPRVKTGGGSPSVQDSAVSDDGTTVTVTRILNPSGGVTDGTLEEADIGDLTHTTDTNANTLCAGGNVYLNGEGQCVTIDSTVYEPSGNYVSWVTIEPSFTSSADDMTLDVSAIGGTNFFEIATSGAFFKMTANPSAVNDDEMFAFTETQGDDTNIIFYEGGVGNNRIWNSGSMRMGGNKSSLCSDLTSDVDCDTASTGADLVVQDDIWAGGYLYSDSIYFDSLMTIGSAVISEAELEIIDGATVTTTELNLLSGITVLSGNNTGDDDVPDAGDFGNATDLDANGAVQWGNLAEGELTNDSIVEADLKAVDAASDEECLTYEVTTGDFEWQACGGGGGTAMLEVILPVQSAKISGSFATDGDATQGAQIDAGDGNWRLLFDATTDEGAVWQFRMPNNYSSSPVLKIGYSMASATANEVEFEGAIMCVSDGDSADVGTASFSTIAVGSATVPATAGYPDVISITLTDDSCAAGDMVWVYLSTDANDATNDDATGDREVVYVSLAYTGS